MFSEPLPLAGVLFWLLLPSLVHGQEHHIWFGAFLKRSQMLSDLSHLLSAYVVSFALNVHCEQGSYAVLFVLVIYIAVISECEDYK